MNKPPPKTVSMTRTACEDTIDTVASSENLVITFNRDSAVRAVNQKTNIVNGYATRGRFIIEYAKIVPGMNDSKRIAKESL